MPKRPHQWIYLRKLSVLSWFFLYFKDYGKITFAIIIIAELWKRYRYKQSSINLENIKKIGYTSSIAGTGFAKNLRDDLFDNIVRISRTVNTKAILFENVKGMFSKSSLTRPPLAISAIA